MILYQIYVGAQNIFLDRCIPTVKAWAEKHGVEYHCDTEVPQKYRHYKHYRTVSDLMRVEFALNTDDDVFYVDGDIEFTGDFDVPDNQESKDADAIITNTDSLAFFIKPKGKLMLFEDVLNTYRERASADPNCHLRTASMWRIWNERSKDYNLVSIPVPLCHYVMSARKNIIGMSEIQTLDKGHPKPEGGRYGSLIHQ